MDEPAAPPPLATTASPIVDPPRSEGPLGPALSIAAVALGALALLGAIIAVTADGSSNFLEGGPIDWQSRFGSFAFEMGSTVGIVAIAALIVDRSATRLLAVLGIAGWVLSRAIIAAEQFRIIDSIR